MPPENNMATGSPTLTVSVVSRSCERERVDDACKGPLAYARGRWKRNSDEGPLAHARSHETGNAFTGMMP